MISRDDFDAYNRAAEAIAAEAEEAVAGSVLEWCRGHPDATVAECRTFAIRCMEGMVQSYDEAAATLAAQWYDGVAEGEGASLRPAVTSVTYSGKLVADTAKYQARKLVAGDVEGFAASCGELARNDALKSVNQTVIANCGRDKREGVRFARVPTGFETCTFCLMLASRGAVYHTRESAGEFGHYHRRCDCKVVPGFADDPMAELVEGHDPRHLLSCIATVEEQSGLSFSAKSDQRSAEYELSLRDPSWTMTGAIPSAVYEKPRGRLLDHERVALDKLLENGFKVKVLDEVPDAPANLDFIIGDVSYELKNVTNANSSVSNQMKRARIKWYKSGTKRPVTCVISLVGCESSFEEVVSRVRSKMRTGEHFIVVSESGDLKTLKK